MKRDANSFENRLVTGAGRYVADKRMPGEAHMVLLRSPYAAGKILSVDVDEARSQPGVIDVITAADLPDRIIGLVPGPRHPAPDGGDMFVPPYPPLTGDFVRYVGDPVAAIIAETQQQALDAMEAVFLDVESTDALVTPRDALNSDTPAIWPQCPDNLCFVYRAGDETATREAISRAPHVLRRDLTISRVTAVALEPRNALAYPDPDGDGLTLCVGTQSPHRMRDVASEAMGLEPGKLRVIAEDTGGSFGMKNACYPEYLVLLLAAERTGRPVRWQPTRSESFAADSHSREQTVEATLALDQDGRFLALHVESLANIGAYLGPMSTHPMVANIGTVSGVYRIPQVSANVSGVFTNTQNMAPYRGAGRPESTYIIERMADLAAAHLGLGSEEIRRRNLVAPEQMPYDTGFLLTYDCGDFPAIMDKALKMADWDGFEQRRADARAQGKLRGIGISNPIEIASGTPEGAAPEYCRIELTPGGLAELSLGAGDCGQGHQTTFVALLSDRLGLDRDSIAYRAGDTGTVAKGRGTFGSRTASASGTVLVRASEKLIDAARAEAAALLGAEIGDVIFEDGIFRATGSNRTLALAELAAKSGKVISAEEFSAADGPTFPNGCHICEVEIDRDTGECDLLSYLVVDDVGTVLNPHLVKGQIMGGIAQGAGQALMEEISYEADSGQLVSASFMDYAMPRAADFPMFAVESHPVPTARNPLGVKGAGEAGVVGSLPALASAVADALRPLGVTHVDMPATPHRIWQAIQDAGKV